MFLYIDNKFFDSPRTKTSNVSVFSFTNGHFFNPKHFYCLYLESVSTSLQLPVRASRKYLQVSLADHHTTFSEKLENFPFGMECKDHLSDRVASIVTLKCKIWRGDSGIDWLAGHYLSSFMVCLLYCFGTLSVGLSWVAVCCF